MPKLPEPFPRTVVLMKLLTATTEVALWILPEAVNDDRLDLRHAANACAAALDALVNDDEVTARSWRDRLENIDATLSKRAGR
ncbi:MAG: hypothetical protein ACOC9R_00280 [bacterium]